MNQKISLDLLSLKYIFDKDKGYIVAGVIILAAFLLFFKFTIPEYELLLATREEARKEQLKLDTLSTNLEILKKANQEKLESQLGTLVTALPLKKDVVQILNSLYFAADTAGVGLGNFSFSLGELDKLENEGSFPAVTLSVPVNGEILAVNNFIKVMRETVPLSQTDMVSIVDDVATVDLSFYYLPQDPSSYNQSTQLKPVSQEDLSLIDQINTLIKNIEEINSASLSADVTPIASSSADQLDLDEF